MNDLIILILAIIVVFLMASIIIRDIFYQKERKDLLNRLMSRDLEEYRTVDRTDLPRGTNKLKERAIEEEFKNFYG